MNHLRALGAAVAFLTILPVRQRSFEEADLADSLVYFPLVGLLLGSGLLTMACMAHHFLSPHLTALCIVAVLVVATGGLHIDGLADVFDGLSSSRDPDRALAVMRDSRIGALGATALVLVLATKTAALTEVVGKDDVWIIFSFPALARWATTIIVVAHPYARSEGLGKPFRLATARHVIFASAWLVALVVADGSVRFAALVTLTTVLLFAYWVRRRLGGLTGDAYGAAIELGETAALLSASIDW
jgi:adenosylcobinamide-GDP ribazoletransferase